jgi:hypothetical protein
LVFVTLSDAALLDRQTQAHIARVGRERLQALLIGACSALRRRSIERPLRVVKDDRRFAGLGV